MITFLVSGIWHGMNWTFVVWGALHGVYNIIHSMIISKTKTKNVQKFKSLKMIGTFFMVDFAWLFFRADSIGHAVRLIKKMITELDLFSVLNYEMAISMGMEFLDIVVLVVALLILVLVDLTSDKMEYSKKIVSKPLLVRWSIFYIVIFIILIFGYYGPEFSAAQFIYAQF